MEKINVYIPVPEGAILAKEQSKALCSQKGVLKYMLVFTPEKVERGDPKRAAVIGRCRRKAFKLATKDKGEYIGMQNADIQHFKKDNYELLIKFLEENPDWGGVSFCTSNYMPRQERPWIHLDCFVLRKDALECVLDYEVRGVDDCRPFANALRKKWRWGYCPEHGKSRLK